MVEPSLFCIVLSTRTKTSWSQTCSPSEPRLPLEDTIGAGPRSCSAPAWAQPTINETFGRGSCLKVILGITAAEFAFGAPTHLKHRLSPSALLMKERLQDGRMISKPS